MYSLQDTEVPVSAPSLYNDLCGRIISMELKPGERISENTISSEYGVSRSVLRSAFARLKQINLIQVLPQRGTFVSLLDPDYIAAAAMIRSVVERDAVYEIFRREDQSILLANLLALLEAQRQMVAEKNFGRIFKELDSKFHLTVIREVYNANTLNLLYEIRVQFSRWCSVDLALSGLEQQLFDQNEEIYNAIRNRRLQLALIRIEEHFQLMVSTLDAVKKVYPHYFSTGKASGKT